ncbi:MAG: hypothetical protein LIP01_08710 [Tannerellaceae bacterium]|nr:hypothetical protein [Tannerellaceae bacterium]
MASFMYVLVTKENFEKLGIEGFRNQVGGYYLLNQKDFSGTPGGTLWEKVSAYNGIIVSDAEAKQLKAGTLSPPSLPDVEKVEEAESSEVAASGEVNSNIGTSSEDSIQEQKRKSKGTRSERDKNQKEEKV